MTLHLPCSVVLASEVHTALTLAKRGLADDYSAVLSLVESAANAVATSTSCATPCENRMTSFGVRVARMICKDPTTDCGNRRNAPPSRKSSRLPSAPVRPAKSSSSTHVQLVWVRKRRDRPTVRPASALLMREADFTEEGAAAAYSVVTPQGFDNFCVKAKTQLGGSTTSSAGSKDSAANEGSSSETSGTTDKSAAGGGETAEGENSAVALMSGRSGLLVAAMAGVIAVVVV